LDFVGGVSESRKYAFLLTAFAIIDAPAIISVPETKSEDM
jgi:hypothetical protein